jgi:hypothetical protein
MARRKRKTGLDRTRLLGTPKRRSKSKTITRVGKKVKTRTTLKRK